MKNFCWQTIYNKNMKPCRRFHASPATIYYPHGAICSFYFWGRIQQNSFMHKVCHLWSLYFAPQRQEPLFSKDRSRFFLTLPVKQGGQGDFQHITMFTKKVTRGGLSPSPSHSYSRIFFYTISCWILKIYKDVFLLFSVTKWPGWGSPPDVRRLGGDENRSLWWKQPDHVS